MHFKSSQQQQQLAHCNMLLWRLSHLPNRLCTSLCPCRDGVDEASAKDGATALGLAIQNNRPDVLGQASSGTPMLAPFCMVYIY
jgi:hypothetical protein